MGIDPAPFWANLYLYFYEHKFITELMATDKTRVRRFLNAMRFIDDECNINDQGEFVRSFSCLLYTSPSPRDPKTSRMPSSA